MNYTQEQKQLLIKIKWHLDNGANKKDAWILKTLEKSNIIIPLTERFTAEELQEQERERERIKKEAAKLRDIPLKKDYEGFGSFDDIL